MYPTDPRQLNTERQIYLDKQFFVDVFSIPACVRNTNGDFIVTGSFKPSGLFPPALQK